VREPGPSWLASLPRAAALAGLLGVLVHLGALGNGFAHDDELVVAADEGLRSLSGLPARLAEPYWPTDSGADVGSWRPLTTGVFGLTWVASGGAPWAFHAVAILLHGLAAAGVVLVLGALTAPMVAAWAGLVFAVHPVHVEAVANVVGLAEPLSAVFALAALGVHLRGPERTGPRRAAVVAGLYALAVLGKEGAVVLPGLLVLVDAARREVRLGELGAYLRRRGLLLVLLTLTLAGLLGARTQVLGGIGGATHPPGAGVLADIPRIWTLATVWPHYLRLLVFPLELAADYSPGILPVAWGWTLPGLLGVGLALGALGVAWLSWRRGPALDDDPASPRLYGLGLVWVGLALLPVANVLFLAPVLLAERTLYLASVGASLALGAAFVHLGRRRPRAAGVAAVLMVVFFGARTVERVPTWRSSTVMATTLLDEHPESGYGWWSLGRRLAREGRPDEALQALGVATQLLNSEPQISLDVGAHLLATGDTGPARFFLERVGRERPRWYSPFGLLAALELQSERPERALPLAREAVELRPGNPSMHHLLGRALSGAGRPMEAARARERALELGFAGGWRAWGDLARDRAAAGDPAGARRALDTAASRADDGRVADSLLLLRDSLSDPSPQN